MHLPCQRHPGNFSATVRMSHRLTTASPWFDTALNRALMACTCLTDFFDFSWWWTVTPQCPFCSSVSSADWLTDLSSEAEHERGRLLIRAYLARETKSCSWILIPTNSTDMHIICNSLFTWLSTYDESGISGRKKLWQFWNRVGHVALKLIQSLSRLDVTFWVVTTGIINYFSLYRGLMAFALPTLIEVEEPGQWEMLWSQRLIWNIQQY